MKDNSTSPKIQNFRFEFGISISGIAVRGGDGRVTGLVVVVWTGWRRTGVNIKINGSNRIRRCEPLSG